MGRMNNINNDASICHVTNGSGWLSQNKNKKTNSSKILFVLFNKNTVDEYFSCVK